MEFKGTKGKWYINKEASTNIIECDTPNWTICETISNYEEDNYNALLISKAPEMLDLLQTLENDNNQIPKWLWDKIQKTIKQATEL